MQADGWGLGRFEELLTQDAPVTRQFLQMVSHRLQHTLAQIAGSQLLQACKNSLLSSLYLGSASPRLYVNLHFIPDWLSGCRSLRLQIKSKPVFLLGLC